MKKRWNEQALRDEGFEGWVQLRSIEAVKTAPQFPGVYVVTSTAAEPIVWQASCGGWFKDRDPAISIERLGLNWVSGAQVVYIGKANELRRRLVEFAKFGLGKKIGHWGGRILWHLPQPDNLRVAWKTVENDVDPEAVEKQLIRNFSESYGKPPFANHPDRDGLLT